MLMAVGIRNHLHAGVVADSSLLHLCELPHFSVRSGQLLELLHIARPHAGLIKRTVVRKQMLVASGESQQQKGHRNELVLHDSILSGARGAAQKCAVRDTRRKYRRGSETTEDNPENCIQLAA